MYTAYKVTHNTNDKMVLNYKECLDNLDEVNGWLVEKQFNQVLIVQDNTQDCIYMFLLESGGYKKEFKCNLSELKIAQ